GSRVRRRADCRRPTPDAAQGRFRPAPRKRRFLEEGQLGGRSVGILHFEPSARLQQFLGRELIADPNLAIIEFIKNSYDAGATDVYVDLTVASRTPEEQLIRISDNGTGMTLEEFRENWMHPGFSYKVNAIPSSN